MRKNYWYLIIVLFKYLIKWSILTFLRNNFIALSPCLSDQLVIFCFVYLFTYIQFINVFKLSIYLSIYVICLFICLFSYLVISIASEMNLYNEDEQSFKITI